MIIDLNLDNKLVMVVGGGKEGFKKINTLLAHKCKILLIDYRINKQILFYIKNKKIIFKKTRLVDANIISNYKPFLVIAATNNKKINKKVIEKAKEVNCYSYTVDDPTISDFSNLATINIENMIQISVSTYKKSPIMSKKIKILTEKIFRNVITKEDLYKIKLQKFLRDRSKEVIVSHTEREKILYNILSDINVIKSIKEKKFIKAKKLAMSILDGSR